MTLNRRRFLKGSLAAVAAAQLVSVAASASQLAQYQQLFDSNRKAGKRPQLANRQQLNLTDFGAVGDGVFNNTEALQQAIAQASAQPDGATIKVAAGQYLIGATELKSKVDLLLEPGAVLLGSVNIEDYYIDGKLKALLYANEAREIAIFGGGTIDGRGRELALNINELHHSGKRVESDFNTWRNRSNHRPNVIGFYHCTKVRIYDISVNNGASWVQHYGACEDLVIDNITVHSDAYWNNDGIDINDCKKVQITGCFINSADDAICLKSTMGPGYFNEDVYIADCVLRSSANGVKFGTESQGGFRRVKIHNIQVFDTYRAAIALEAVDGAFLEDIEVDGVDARHVGCALFLRLGQRNMHVAKDTPVGRFQNVSLKNIKADIAFERADLHYEVRGPALNAFFNPIPASITGLPDAPLNGISLENIEIHYPGRANKGLAYRPYHQLFLVPQERDAYPEYSMFGELPAYGLYVRHVNGLSLKNIRFSSREADFRPALILDDVKQLRLERAQLAGSQRPQLVMQQVPSPQLTAISGTDAAGQPVVLTAADMAVVQAQTNR
ncbi:polygalacturonase [Rheinheimera pacifica]|uniref:glycoside hydrolase family 28 protein n=1 Tax=Rheinheimera pacifica TaxID=173990 RepID=UPI0021684899|nr:glycosyl hydrolase family 28 protein [Rheinheimera pacifica]MCS4307638.1 polygalacturonase [Rheinheimera pacifica]